MRHDRDDFISINWENVDPRRVTDFEKRPYGIAGDHPDGGVDTRHTPYDFNSVKSEKRECPMPNFHTSKRNNGKSSIISFWAKFEAIGQNPK